MLDNKQLITTHLHSLILETMEDKTRNRYRQILRPNEPNYPMLPDYKNNLSRKVTDAKQRILESAKSAFSLEMATYPWFTEAFVNQTIDSFLTTLRAHLNTGEKNTQPLIGNTKT